MKRACCSLLALVVAAACTERPNSLSVQKQAGKPRSVAVGGDYVATPGGWYHRTCVHEIPNGARVDSGGLVTRKDGSTYQTPSCSYASYRTARHAPPAAPLVDGYTGWTEWAGDTLPGSDWFTKITAYWTVPDAPLGSYSGGQVYYTFPALESMYDMLLPQLQYGNNGVFGGSYWMAASWFCDPYSCWYSQPIGTATHHIIYGRVVASNCYTGHPGTKCNWTVFAKDSSTDSSTTFTVDSITNAFWAADGGAVRVVNFTSCDQYPRLGVWYSGVALYDSTGYQLQPCCVHWMDTLMPGASPSCQFKVTSNYNVVNLWHNVPAPPSVSISGPSRVRPNVYCKWTADATGGVAPISYLWSPLGQQTSQITMSWPQSGTLSVQVTDSLSQQGSASKSITVSPSAPACPT